MRKQIFHAPAAYAILVACNPPAAMDPAFATDASTDISPEASTTSTAAASTSPTTSDGDASSATTATTDDDSADPSSGGAICGDGILEGDELCDDGNTYNVDGCTASCKPAACGDRILQFEWEQCDNGPDNGPGMPCNSECELNVCGDGDPGPKEACDDGNADDTDACTSICELAICGDGIVHSGVESCDDHGADHGDSATCDGDCTLAECGDMHINSAAGEECDDGNNSSLDNCYTSCKAPTLRLFITSEVYTGALGGLLGADFKCQSLAKKAALPGTYKAWLASESNPGATRLYHSLGRYKRLDGVIVADNFEQLRDGPLHAPVTLTDTMQDVHALDMMEPHQQGVYKSHVSYWSWEGDTGFQHREGYCHDWTVVRGMGAVSKVEKPEQGASDIQFLFPCDAFMALLCVQQAWYPEG